MTSAAGVAASGCGSSDDDATSGAQGTASGSGASTGGDPGSSSSGAGGSSGSGGSGGSSSGSGGTGGGGAEAAFPIADVAGHCDVIWVRSGQAENERLGGSLEGLEDVSGDGKRDVAYVGSGPSRLERLSGADGALLGQKEYKGLGYIESAGGDLNVDGFTDLVANAQECEEPDSGTASSGDCRSVVRVLSATDGGELLVFEGPKGNLSFIGGLVVVEDRDADAKPDLLIGSPPADPIAPAGTLTYTSSATKQALGPLAVPPGAGPWVGMAFARLPDRDDDMRSEIVAADGSAEGFLGALYAIGTSNQNLYWKHVGEVTESDPDLYGSPLIVAGDLSGDGKPDVVAGAHNHVAGPNLTEAGVVRAVDGDTGALLWELKGARAYEHFGVSLAAADDLNGDGRPEVIAGASSAPLGVITPGLGGRVVVIDGATGKALLDVRHDVPADKHHVYRFGAGVAFVGAAGAGQFDLAASADGAEINGLARAGQVLGLRCLLTGAGN